MWIRSITKMRFGILTDVSAKEVKEFLEQMNSKQFKDIEKFFETMPKLIHTIEVINPKTKVKSPIVLEGLNSFFTRDGTHVS